MPPILIPWLGDFQEQDLNPSAEGYETTIKNRLGDFGLWHVFWNKGNWMVIRTSKEWVYLQRPVREEEEAEQYPDDGDHILVFPMDREGLCPRAWFEAAWPFLEHFRSNFCFYPQEAFMYKRITLVGPPLGTRQGVAQEVEDALKSKEWRQVERIWCTSADDLKKVLQRRVEDGLRFRGDDELTPSEAT
jgi:hypothetical protein